MKFVLTTHIGRGKGYASERGDGFSPKLSEAMLTTERRTWETIRCGNPARWRGAVIEEVTDMELFEAKLAGK